MSLTLLVDDNGNPISQSFAQPNCTRGFVLDDPDPDTGGRSDTVTGNVSPEDSESSAPVVVHHYIFEIFIFVSFSSSIPMYFMAFEYFAKNARLASLSSATPTLLSKWYTFWASIFLVIGVAGFLLVCDFLKDLSTALARKGRKWYTHQFSLFDPKIVTIGEDLAITGKGIVLWKVWGITLEGLLFFCTKKELAESWRTGCQCQSYIGTILWAFRIMGYANFAMIHFFIWFIMIINFMAVILSPISSYHTRARQIVEVCSLIISIMIAATTIS